MHASLWTFTGDSDDLLRRYDAMVAEIPLEEMALHVAMRVPDGLLIFDTCPTEDAFRSFIGGEWFAELRARHGLPPLSKVEDYPVDRVIVDGKQVAAA